MNAAADSEALRRGLPDIADGLSAQLHELAARPDAAVAETVAANLAGAHRAVLRFREALLASEVPA